MRPETPKKGPAAALRQRGLSSAPKRPGPEEAKARLLLQCRLGRADGQKGARPSQDHHQTPGALGVGPV